MMKKMKPKLDLPPLQTERMHSSCGTMILILVLLLATIVTISGIPVAKSFEPHDTTTRRVQACGISSEYNWVNWMESIETDFPLVFPKTDQDLQGIIQAAGQGGCKVRPVGTGHSYSGIVANKVEHHGGSSSSNNVIIVNLADYEPPPDWHYVLDEDRLRVRMSAGATLVDLQRFLLEKGYRLPIHTGGPLFSLGGVYLNPSVHGNTIGEDRCTSLLTGVRAVTGNGNGTIIEVWENDGIEDWRGSMGLLGIALAIELRVYKFNGISLNRRSVKFGKKNWNRENFEEVLQSELAGKDYFTFGYKYWDNECLFFTGYIDGRPQDYDLEAALDFYDNVKTKVPDMAKTGGKKTPTIALELLDTSPTSILESELLWLFFETSMDSAIKNPGDGYFLFPDGQGSSALEVHASIKCVTDCISDGIFFGVIDASRKYFDEAADAVFPTSNIGIRFFDVKQDMMRLEHLQPGRHIGVYFGELRSPEGNTVQPLQKKLMGLQLVWDELSGGTIGGHHSKHYGIGPVGDLDGVYPYQNETFANRFYDATTRSNFLNLMNQYDPQGIFAAGEALFLLGVSTNKFEPRKTNYEATKLADTGCKSEGDAECISGCCCSLCGCAREDESLGKKSSGLFQCTEGGLLTTGSKCAVDCECSTGHCDKFILQCT
jgi:FAD binding domain